MIRFVLTFILLGVYSVSFTQDLCSGAYDEGELTCGASISGSGDAGTTPDPEAINCMVGLDGTWFTFTTNDAVQEFTISGPDFNLFEGDCSGLNAVVDCGNGLIVAADPSTTYYVLVNGDFTVDAPSSPSNDDCSNAAPASGSGISGDNNNCATTDDGICGSDGNASVWYEYTLDQDLSLFEIDLTSQGITDPVLAIYSDCSTLLLEECSASLMITCLATGTYYIQVASDFGNTGEFDIAFTETTSSVSNDDCSNADDITPSIVCGPETVDGDSTGACPEPSDFGSGCDIDVNPTVWFEFTTTSAATSVDFSELSSNLELAILDGCGGSSVTPCVTGDTNFPVSGNTTYLIGAALTSGEGTFSFDITMNEPPQNDACGNAADIESGDGLNTCCGIIEGTDACGGSETGVWLVYAGVDGDGSVFNFTNIDMSGNIGIEIYAGSCGGELLNEPYCGGAGSYTFETPNCGEDFMYIHVTSSLDGCGSFELTVDPAVACAFGEECGDGALMSPTTGSGEVCETGCTTFSCDSDCGSQGGVWFEVLTDELATEMTVVVNDVGGGNIDPIISIHQVDCGSILSGCNDVASGDIVEVAVSGNLTYYIEVSTGSGGDPGEFEVCVATDESEVECSEGSIEPTRPEYPDADPEGPYCPGEIVNFCYEVTFTVDPIGEGNNCQWIQGIIPTVGGGWDLESLPIDVQGPGGSWFWLPEGDVAYLAPSSVLGTIDTPNGLGLEYGPGTLSDGDPLPGGWWATSDGGGGCANDGNPNTMWGLPASCGSTQEVEFCFDLQVGLLDDIGQCDDEDFTDLKVHIFTMADGQTGCWSNNSCSGDIPVTFNAILDCTSLVFILGDDVEICHDQVLDIPLESEDGSDVDIIVEVFDEGNTSGASDHIFPGGMGVIADQIENDGDEITILYYEVYALDPESICEGPRTLIEVVVYPEIEVEGEDPYYICFQDPMEITPLVSGGNGGPYEYLWEDGSSDASIVLPENPDLFPGEYEIRLLVTDEFGCTKDVAIEYEIIEPLYPEIINPYVGVCKDGILDLPELFLEFESAGTGPYEFQWESNPTGLEFVNGDDSQNLIINEEESSARTYTIFGTIIDDFGCEYSAQTEFIVDNGPDMILEIDECFGTAFNLIGYDRDGLMVTFELFYDDNGDWIYDGTTILNATSVATAFGDNITYLAEEYGTYLLLGTSTNGCTDYVELELPPVPLPQFEVIPNDTICQGTTVTISLLNVDDYVDLDWSNGESTDSIVVTPLDTITYYLVAETNDDCVVTDSIKIVVNPLPDINVTGSTSICPGAQTILTAQGDPANSYLWTGPSGTMITTQTATIAAGGDWNLDVVTPSGCLSSQIISIDVNQQLNPEIDGGNLCTGSVVELNGGPGFDEYEWLDDNNDNVGNTQTIEVSTGGIYTLNVVLGSGMSACSGTDDFEVLQFDPLPNALIQLNTAVCNINTGGLPTFVDLTSFETGVNGSWFDENNIPVSTPDNVDFTGQLPGSLNYTFVTNQAQEPCTEDTYVFTIDVSDCSCPSVAINTPPDFCNEPDTFDLSLIQITTEPGIWSVLPAGMAILNDQLISSDQTPPGVYTLTFTLDDINQPAECSIDSSVTFVVFNELSAELASNVTVCNEDTGNGPDFIDLDDLFISGDPGTWSTNEMGLTIDADNVVSFTSQPLGDYRFFYFMEELNSPCDPVSIPLDITVRDCSCPELALAALPPLCNSGGTYNLETLLTNPENEPGVWSINGPDDSVLIGTSVFSDDRPAGTYELTFTFTNSLGGSCTNSISGDLEIIDPPSAEISEIESACNGTNITVFPTALDFTTFVSGSEGMWTAPLNYNGGFIDDVMAVDFLDVNPGIYVFTYTTTTAIAPCDNVSYTMEVEVRNCNCPSVAFISPTPVCNDGPPVDLNSYIPPNSPEGEWSFVNGTPSVAIANGSIIDISVLNGFYLFQYTLNEVPIGCPEFGQISIEVVTPPIVNHIPNVEVCNEVSINGPNCIDLTTYLTGAPGDWTIPSNYDGDASDLGNICFDSDDVGEVLEFVFNTATGSVTCDERAYTTEVIIKDCSCPNLSIIPPNSLCNLNGNLDLSSLETSDIEPGTWSVVNGPTAISLSGNILSLNGEEAGIYTLQYTPNITPSADCDQFSQTTLEVVDYPSVGELAFTQLCIKDGEVVQLDDLLNNQDAGGRWSSVVNTAGFNFADNTFTGDGQEPGMYEFVYAFENIAPCPDNSISVEVIVIPDIETEVENSPCADANDGAIIVASVPSGGGTYLYSIDGGSTWTQNTNFNNLAPGSYTILIEDENGCQSELPNLIISEPGPFSVDTGEDRNIEADIGAVTLELATSVDVSMIANIVWTEDGNVICSGGVDQCLIIEVDPDGIGEYCATVTDLNGCVSEDCVVVRERIVKDVYIPNTFSPFSNDNNNIFYVQADQYVETVNEFLIMDRWGELVFAAEPNHTPNDKEFGWDGTFNGGVVEQGVYVYMVTVTYADGEEELFVGNITALR